MAYVKLLTSTAKPRELRCAAVRAMLHQALMSSSSLLCRQRSRNMQQTVHSDRHQEGHRNLQLSTGKADLYEAGIASDAPHKGLM